MTSSVWNPVNLPEAIDRFFADRKVQRMLDLARETRPLQICYPRELPISRFLSWILDPSQGHGLQDAPIRRLLTAAWTNRDDASLDLSIERHLSPASLSTRSFAGVLVQKEARLVEGSGQLDVLVLHPREKFLEAIENKFGAMQGEEQLSKYSAALAERYPDWKRVQIFLDYDGQPPNDDTWIGLNFDWLVEELRVAESSPWLGEEPRRIIQEFRNYIDPEGAVFAHLELEDSDLLEVVREHRDVIKCMAEWQRSREKLPELVERIYASSTTLHDKAIQNLFPVYWQRSSLWSRCIPMLSYAQFYEAALGRYEDIEHDPHRKAFFYRLPAWADVEDENAEYWGLEVMVRILPENERWGKDRFVISTALNIDQVDETYEDRMRVLAEQLRGEYMKKKRALKEDQGRIALRVDRAQSDSDAIKKMLAHLAMLEVAMQGILHD